MKTFSGIILSSKVTILHFSHKNVGMISHTLYFFYNNSLLHGHENYKTLIFVVIDFDPEKIERKGGASFLAFSICLKFNKTLTNDVVSFEQMAPGSEGTVLTGST